MFSFVETIIVVSMYWDSCIMICNHLNRKIANVLIMKMQNRHILLEDALGEFLQEDQVDYISEEFIELYQQYQGTIDYIKALYF